MVSSLDLLHLARTAAERAAEYLRGVERPADPSSWTLKGSRDFVTDVDRTAERIIGEVLLAAEPGSRIVGEELHPELVTEGMVWIVDPLDGTTNFLHDFPSYAVSIAAAMDGTLEAGGHRQRAAGRDLHRVAGGRGVARGPEARGVRHRRSGLRAHRYRLPLQGREPDRRVFRPVPASRRSDQRHPASGCSLARPGRRRRREVRRILGAGAIRLGYRGRHAAHPRGGWHGDGLRRA